jgi:hypothetical protein
MVPDWLICLCWRLRIAWVAMFFLFAHSLSCNAGWVVLAGISDGGAFLMLNRYSLGMCCASSCVVLCQALHAYCIDVVVAYANLVCL